MGKFRSKLKRHTKGKSWGHGQSATSNPENKKHRNKARSRFFQANLSLAPATDDTKSNTLTMSAIMKHDARNSYSANNVDPTVNDIAISLKSFNFDGDDENMTQTQTGTYRTFATNYSSCTNMSFSKLLNGFRSDSQLHKEMLAILAALTDVIKERGGTQTSTEYFLALMETIEAANEETEIIASISLLNMGIRTVSEAVLRMKFSETAGLLMMHMQKFVDTDNQNILKNIIGALSVLLRAQEYSVWSLSSTGDFFDAILAFTIHSRPKVRKAAQHAIASIIHGSCFMPAPLSKESVDAIPSQITSHPASGRVAKFCVKQFRPENIANAHTLVLHTLGLLHNTLNGFKCDDIKMICEHLLSIMTATNVMIRTACFHTMHSMFSSKTQNLNAILTGKLISAIYDYRPERTDVRQTLAWITVLKEAHICLATYDISMCIQSLPKFIDICATDLWMSERNEIVAGISNAIKELYIECIQPGCETKKLAEIHQMPIAKTIASVTKALSAPFGQVSTQVILVFSTIFETTGKFFGDILKDPLATIAARYDVESSFRLQIEHAVLAAIRSIGPDIVLQAIPLTDETGNVSINRSWLLPLLREAISESTLEYFTDNILKLAAQCNKNWHQYKAANNMPLAHTYELLCCQLWGLFPGFCRKPLDMYNFRYIAKTLGTVLNENPELRPSVLDGLKELMTNADDDGKNELSKYAKNYLPRLFNIYSQKPTGSYENELRQNAMEVIKEYIKITPKNILNEMYESAKTQHSTMKVGTFAAESVFDIIQQLAIYQSNTQIESLFNDFVRPVLQRDSKNSKMVAKNVDRLKQQQRKAYQLLNDVLESTNDDCIVFVSDNIEKIQDLVLTSLKMNCSPTQITRLNCIKILLDKSDDITADSKLIGKTIPEIIVALNVSNKKENVAINLLLKIGEIYQAEEQLNEFVDLIMAGFGGDTLLITNTILALKTIVNHFTGNLTVTTLQFILEQILAFLVGKNRSEVEASVAFLITFIKVLPSPLVANHLETIVRSLSSMVPDTKRYCRIHLGYILKKLCKKFTPEEIIKLVPGNDEVTHKKLKNIRKEQNREKRQKLAKPNDDNSDDDDTTDNLTSGLSKKSYAIDDILADSDSDLDDDMDVDDGKLSRDAATTHKRLGKKQHETFIQEDPDSIVDLTDLNAIGQITTSKPLPSTSTGITQPNQTKKPRDINRGFKTADDGRLIIAEPKFGNKNGNDSDSDDYNLDDKKDLASAGKKRSMNADSDSDSNSDVVPPTRKRKTGSGPLSAKSGATGTTNNSKKYMPGGKGIHRSMNGSGAASVASGASRMSMATTKAAASQYGSEYKSKKSKGDMKQKGKMDPYAYIPLSRNVLNKRKRAKHQGQFKNIVKGARKGAAAGVKNKVSKGYKKK